MNKTLSTNGSNGNKGNGSKGLVWLVALALIAVGVCNMIGCGEDKTSSNNGGTTIIYQTNGNDQTSKSEEEEEEVKTPISTKYSCQGNYWSVFTQKQNVTDNFGTTYETANEAFVSINAGSKKLTYSLDGSYSYLKGTIYLSEGNKDNINYFKVYVYDEKGNCIYESEELSDKNLGPIHVRCNIAGLTRVTIEMEGCTKTCSGIRIIMPDEGFVFVE